MSSVNFHVQLYGFLERVHPAFHGLPWKIIHQVNADAQAQFASVSNGFFHVCSGVGQAHHLSDFVVESLGAHVHLVNAVIGEFVNFFKRQRLGGACDFDEVFFVYGEVVLCRSL